MNKEGQAHFHSISVENRLVFWTKGRSKEQREGGLFIGGINDIME